MNMLNNLVKPDGGQPIKKFSLMLKNSIETKSD